MIRIIQEHPTLVARSYPRLVVAAFVAGALLLAVTAVQAATTPEQACKSGKNKTAGKYAAGRDNAEAKLAARIEIQSVPAPPWRSGKNLAREKTLVTLTVHGTAGYSHGA